MKRVHLRITGDVQGVGFRYTMQMIADRAGATGWVRNRRDGSVEAEVEGSADAVDSVVAWAHEGPPGSRVDSVDVGDVESENSRAFEVRGSA